MKSFEFRGADYEYLTEGASSMLLQPSSSSSLQNFPPMVLKIAKRFPSDERVFVGFKSFMDAWFDGKYILRPMHYMYLRRAELDKLYMRINPFRCANRCEKGSHYPLYGSIEQNLTLSCEEITLSFELKVKCGLKSYSPFVRTEFMGDQRTDRSVKHKISRYALIQLVKLHESIRRVETPWGKFEKMSEYNPSDLCSRSLVRVRNALKALLCNPQNNLRVCFSGKHIYGWNIASMDEFIKILSTLSSATVLVPPIDYLADVLVRENVLQRLESLQALDAFTDIEGCEAIFTRLVELSAGCEYMAVQKIVQSKKINDFPLEELAIIHAWIKEIEAGNFQRGLYELSEIFLSDFLRKMLQLTPLTAIKGAVNVHEMNSSSRDSWLRTLTEDECILFVQFWLIALGAKDASLVVTLTQSSLSSSWSHDTHLIDVGPKPISKIFQKISTEPEIIEKASLALKNLIE